MLTNLEVRLSPHLEDGVGVKTAGGIRAALDLPVTGARTASIFTVEGLDEKEILLALERAALHDPVLQQASLTPFEPPEGTTWIIEVGFRPGVTDNEARTARDTLALVLGRACDFSVYMAKR